MPPNRQSCRTAPAKLALLGLLALTGCTSIGDFGRVQPDLVSDDIHDWVGQEAARQAGAPISTNNLTDDERTLRDLAFPLIEPPYDRQRWNAVVYEYGFDRAFRRELWIDDPTAYYMHLKESSHRSTAGRYSQLMDDIRNDIVRIGPFLAVARRVVDLDRRREASMAAVADLTPAERLSARARVGENALTIAWVQHSLTERCASYRFALEHLAVAEPDSMAADVDRVLTELQQQIAASASLVPEPQFAAAPVAAAR
ncbi:MAG TPA: hypothetical protein VMF12_11135 [Xanthobacteraceae bacterium]|nr:hypothetical protein [Xanthobacteraceae bacterium]